ncbi:MAG: hypothetical protein ABIG68_01500, partial [Acidobacteriota bacterium]
MIRRATVIVLSLAAACVAALAQAPPEPPPLPGPKVTAVKAGRLIDPETGRAASNQVILVEGERIRDVGPAV